MKNDVAHVMRAARTPHGYTLAVGAAGEVCISAHGQPGFGAVLLFATGATCVFGLISTTVATSRGVSPSTRSPMSMPPVSGPAKPSPRSSRRVRSGRPNRSTRTTWSSTRTATPATSSGPIGDCHTTRTHRPRESPAAASRGSTWRGEPRSMTESAASDRDGVRRILLAPSRARRGGSVGLPSACSSNRPTRHRWAAGQTSPKPSASLQPPRPTNQYPAPPNPRPEE